jgi:hypothetical protein
MTDAACSSLVGSTCAYVDSVTIGEQGAEAPSGDSPAQPAEPKPGD